MHHADLPRNSRPPRNMNQRRRSESRRKSTPKLRRISSQGTTDSSPIFRVKQEGGRDSENANDFRGNRTQYFLEQNAPAFSPPGGGCVALYPYIYTHINMISAYFLDTSTFGPSFAECRRDSPRLGGPGNPATSSGLPLRRRGRPNRSQSQSTGLQAFQTNRVLYRARALFFLSYIKGFLPSLLRVAL